MTADVSSNGYNTYLHPKHSKVLDNNCAHKVFWLRLDIETPV